MLLLPLILGSCATTEDNMTTSTPMDSMMQKTDMMITNNETAVPSDMMKDKPLQQAVEVNMKDPMYSDGMESYQQNYQMQSMKPQYIPYTKETATSLQENSRKFIAFFHADWCPTCRAWETKIEAALHTLPNNTVVLKVNYDEEAALARSLGVTSQSSAVFFDADGNTSVEINPSMESVSNFFSAVE